LAEILVKIGAEVSCSDGVCGKVVRVVVDPVARELTHLVAEPTHRPGLARLVPLGLVDAATAQQVRLRCSRAEFNGLPLAEATHFVPRSSLEQYSGYSAEQLYVLPYYSWAVDADMSQIPAAGAAGTYGSLPPDEVDVRRGKRVYATDGEIGRVEGLVINPGSHHVSHVLLQEGHVFGRKEVVIPIGAVTGVVDGVYLNLTKQQTQDLPLVTIGHPSEEADHGIASAS
jgi:sporulation protein YlmC with PRC-barrel domain